MKESQKRGQWIGLMVWLPWIVFQEFRALLYILGFLPSLPESLHRDHEPSILLRGYDFVSLIFLFFLRLISSRQNRMRALTYVTSSEQEKIGLSCFGKELEKVLEDKNSY